MTATSPEKTIDINVAELVNLAAKLIHALFVFEPEQQARQVFKDLKNGRRINLGEFMLNEGGAGQRVAALHLALDRSEFRGPGFNFDVFTAAVKQVLQRIGDTLQRRGDLNVMTGENGSVLIHLPGLVVAREQLNVLAMAFDLADPAAIVVRLMYLDPDQYEQFRVTE